MKRSTLASPFFGLNDHMPVVLALLLGFQHALAMLAGVITPPILLGGPAGANLTAEYQEYLGEWDAVFLMVDVYMCM